MGIGSITPVNSMSGIRTLTASSTDLKSKSIKNEITNVQQQMQKLSSNEELSSNEKANERKKLQKEISSLNTDLRQHQEELSRSQKKEIKASELQEGKKITKEEKAEEKIQTTETALGQTDKKLPPTDKQQTRQPGTIIAQNSDGIVIFKEDINQEEKRGIDTEKKQADGDKEKSTPEKEPKATDNNISKDAGLSPQKTQAIVSADSSVQQAGQQRTIIAKTRDGIAILKGEINQDEKRGEDTEKKQAELEKMARKEQRATAFQFSILNGRNNTIKPASDVQVAGIKDSAQDKEKNDAFDNALRISQENDQASQQRFHVAFG